MSYDIERVQAGTPQAVEVELMGPESVTDILSTGDPRQPLGDRHPRLKRGIATAALLLAFGAGAVTYRSASHDSSRRQIDGLKVLLHRAQEEQPNNKLNDAYNDGIIFGYAQNDADHLTTALNSQGLSNQHEVAVPYWQGTIEWNSGDAWVPYWRDPIALHDSERIAKIPRYDRVTTTYFGVYLSDGKGEWYVQPILLGKDYRFVPDIAGSDNPLRIHEVSVVGLGNSATLPTGLGLMAVGQDGRPLHAPDGRQITPGRQLT